MARIWPRVVYGLLLIVGGTSFGAVDVSLPGLAGAVTLDGSYVIVKPDAGPLCIDEALGVAANVLAKSLREGAGLDVKVVKASDDRGGKAIRLGARAAAAAGIDLTGYRHFDNLIVEKDGSVYLCGNDAPGARPSKGGRLGWSQCKLPTVKALTRFMETYMDCRFVMPGETGLDVPKVAKVEVPDGLVSSERPQFEASMARVGDMMNDIANGNFGSGGYRGFGGHTWAYAFRVEDHFEKHPDWYALRNGVRRGVKGNPSICFSNKEAEDHLVAFMADEFDKGYDVVELGQNDGTEYCQCEKCLAMGQGHGIGEAIQVFHRRVAERLLSLRPGKRVMIIAYSVTQQPPKTFNAYPANVQVEICHPSETLFDAWAPIRVPGGMAVYLYEFGSYPQPGFTAKCSFAHLAKMARMLHAHNVKAIYRCGYGEGFGMEGAGYYVFNRLLEDPKRDVDALVNDFCRHAYGAVAKQMMAFYRRLDSRLAAHDALKRLARPSCPADLFAYMYTPSTIEALEGSLAGAERAATDAKVKRRLALVRKEFEYVKSLATISILHAAYRIRPTKESFVPLAEEILRRNAMVDSFFDAKGRMKAIEGWPELRFFGYGSPNKATVKVNGRLGAVLAAPFGWDVKYLQENGILPGATRKEMVVRRARTNPTLADFKSDAGAWKGLKWEELAGMQMEQVKTRTRFKATYDDENLYVAVETTLDDAIVVEPQGRDGIAFRFDDIEAMFDPTGCHERYYQLVWNPVPNSTNDGACGLIEDPLDPKYGKMDMEWNGDWSYENDRENGVWRTMLTLPFKTVGAKTPASGEVWTMNIGRSHDYDFSTGNAERSLWNPNLETIRFSAPEAFGKVVFE